MMKPIAPLLILLIFAAPSIAQPTAVSEPRPLGSDARTLVDEANHALAEGDYDRALEGYAAAEVARPELPELAYNQALAHYRLGNFETARALFNKALATRDLTLEGKAKYNLGNTAYASALEKLSNMPEAIEYLKTAIGRYRDALEIVPEDEDAKANIETAQLLIKDLFDKLKQQQEQQQQQGENQQDEQQQEDQQPQDQQQDPEGEQERQDESQGDQQQDQEQTEQAQQPEPQDAAQPDEAQSPREAVREMTKEEAERLLQAVRDKERRRREQKAERMRVQRVPVLRDW